MTTGSAGDWPQVWQPPEGVTDHSGEPLSPQWEFFAPPPAEIGQVLTVRSSLKNGKRQMGFPTRLLAAGLGAAILPLADLWLTALTGHDLDPLVLGITIFGGVVLGGLILGVTRFRCDCSFVGELGVAQFALRGSRNARPRRTLLEFSGASALYTEQTCDLSEGIVSRYTNYRFTWRGAAGELLELKGTYRTRKQRPPSPDEPYYLALAAERAWSEYKLQDIPRELEAGGCVHFLINDVLTVVVELDAVTFKTPEGAQRVEAADFKTVTIFNGTFRFTHRDARWFSGKGKYSFRYAEMPNARLFLLCLDRIAGLCFDFDG